jgi:hypothetical protein
VSELVCPLNGEVRGCLTCGERVRHHREEHVAPGSLPVWCEVHRRPLVTRKSLNSEGAP